VVVGTSGAASPSIHIIEYPVPTASAMPLGITPGPDGNVWFTENAKNQVAKITPSGVVTEYPFPPPTASRA